MEILTYPILVADQVGSPLSISLASSDGMSISLRSTSELRNIQPLVLGNPGPSSANFDPQSVIYPNTVQPTLQRQQSIHDDAPMNSNAPASSQNPIQRKK